MAIEEAVSLMLALLQAATNGLSLATQVSTLIQTATAQGRTSLTTEEMAQCVALDDAARKMLADAITKAQSGANP